MRKKNISYISFIIILFSVIYTQVFNAEEKTTDTKNNSSSKETNLPANTAAFVYRDVIPTSKSKLRVVPEELILSTTPKNLYLMEGLVMNILGESGQEGRYLELSIYVSMSNDRLAEEITKQKGILNDSLVYIFSNKEFTDVMTTAAKLEIKDTIIRNFNNNLRTGAVVDVYYKSFIVY